MKIRQYKKTDRDAVRYICLNSDGPEENSAEREHFILTTYCDYFIEKESENCFVAVNEEDTPIGYILCTENFDRFWDCFKKEYLPRIPEAQTLFRQYASSSAVLQEKYKEEYPAHLHIDILPEYQRMGIGHMLMNTLIGHLREKNVKGIVINVAQINEKGIAFYKKYGFSLTEDSNAGTVFTMKLK